MRQFIDIVSLLEAPINDITLMGDPDAGADVGFDQGESFGKVDRAILQSPKGVAKIYRAFSRTPHVFEVFFINTVGSVDGDHAGDNNLVDGRAAIHSGIFHDERWVKPKEGVIRVVLLSNLSPLENKMPIGGWTLAHKIGHVFQDQAINQRGVDAYRIPLIDRVNNLLYVLANPEQHPLIDRRMPFGEFGGHDRALNNRLTMKSARDGELENPFEVFAEVIAQYLVAGRVKLQGLRPKHAYLETELNKAIAALFGTCEGCIMVQV